MRHHEEWDLLSAFSDGELTGQERVSVESHLASCSDCSEELRALSGMKHLVKAAPRRSLPPELLAALEEELSKPTWRERLYSLLSTPRVVVPLGAAVTLAIGLLLWTGGLESDEIAFEPLMAAHMRYAAEGLVSQEDLVHPEYVAHLAAYDAD